MNRQASEPTGSATVIHSECSTLVLLSVKLGLLMQALEAHSSCAP